MELDANLVFLIPCGRGSQLSETGQSWWTIGGEWGRIFPDRPLLPCYKDQNTHFLTVSLYSGPVELPDTQQGRSSAQVLVSLPLPMILNILSTDFSLPVASKFWGIQAVCEKGLVKC